MTPLQPVGTLRGGQCFCTFDFVFQSVYLKLPYNLPLVCVQLSFVEEICHYIFVSKSCAV